MKHLWQSCQALNAVAPWWVVPVVASLIAATSMAWADGARADAGDSDPALRAWVPVVVPERRGPPDPLDWERRTRSAAALGPAPLRPSDRALLDAARTDRWTEALELLKSGRAAANARDLDGAHTLAYAAAAGRDDVVRALVQRGVVLDRTDHRGLTPLGAAAWYGRRSTVRLLLRAGADPRAFSRNGYTALHLAAAVGQEPIVGDLLARGVPIELLNRSRESALDVAAASQQDAVLDLLIQAGADMTMAGSR